MSSSVKWPTGEFTVRDLATLNPDFVELTLRVRLDREINETGTVEVVRMEEIRRGRPRVVFRRKASSA